MCTLCDKRMENKHWTSAKHVAAVKYVLELQQGIDGWYTQPPLPQPPPPPMRDDDAHPPPVAEDGQVDLHPWGSYGPNGEVLNPQQWKYMVQEHDEKYAGNWWPIDQEWLFIDV